MHDVSKNPYETPLAESHVNGLTDAHRAILGALSDAWHKKADAEDSLAKARERVGTYETVVPIYTQAETDLRGIFERETGQILPDTV